MYNLNIVKQIAIERGCKLFVDEPMKNLTSFKIGGNAQLLIIANTIKGLIAVTKECSKNSIPVFVLGKGSNLLVSDNGIKGVVIKLGKDFKSISIIDNDTIRCGAGVSLAKLCIFACEHSLSGLEFAWGIPGSVGGAAFMNAGAYGGEMKDVLIECKHITQNGEIGKYDKKDLDLSYRHSIYSDKNYIITDAIFKLNRDSSVEIRTKMDDFMNRRKDKQPLDYPSAGSVFKRPKGYFAGTLIEKSNLKGVSIGDAQVSEKHAGFIINKGNATCEDVLNLVQKIKNTVKKDSGVELECEIKAIN